MITDISSLVALRNELKSYLASQRKELGTHGMRPVCPICRRQILKNESIEMHEVFVTRGDVRGLAQDDKNKIFVKENCVLVHGKCHGSATRYEEKLRCCAQIIDYEGYDEVMMWIQGMEEILPKTIFNQIKDLAQEANKIF